MIFSRPGIACAHCAEPFALSMTLLKAESLSAGIGTTP
jgi:hypothetical protein